MFTCVCVCVQEMESSQIMTAEVMGQLFVAAETNSIKGSNYSTVIHLSSCGSRQPGLVNHFLPCGQTHGQWVCRSCGCVRLSLSLTMFLVTVLKQSRCSSGGRMEKPLSDQHFTKCSATHLRTERTWKNDKNSLDQNS